MIANLSMGMLDADDRTKKLHVIPYLSKEVCFACAQ